MLPCRVYDQSMRWTSRHRARRARMRKVSGRVLAIKHSLANSDDEDEFRGGFVLRVHSGAPARRRRSLSERSLAVKRTILSNLRIKKQHSTGDIHQRVASTTGHFKSSDQLETRQLQVVYDRAAAQRASLPTTSPNDNDVAAPILLL